MFSFWLRRKSAYDAALDMAPSSVRSIFITDCPHLSDFFIDFISVKRGRPSTVINSCSRPRIPLSQLVASDRLGDAYYTSANVGGSQSH